MNSSPLSNLTSVRLASGVEMQQRWSPTASVDDSTSEQQKGKEFPRVIKMTPSRGSEGINITVVVQSLPYSLMPVKLAFNSLLVDTKQIQLQDMTSLVARVPPFRHTQSTSAQVPISICCMSEQDTVTATWPITHFTFEFDNKDNTSLDYSTRRSLLSDTSFEDKTDDYLNNSNYDTFYANNNNSSYNTSFNYYNNNNNNNNDDAKYAYRPNSQDRANDDPSLGYSPESSNAINLFNPNSSNYTSMMTGFNQLEPQSLSGLSSNCSTINNTAGYQSTMRNHHAYGYNKSSHFPTTSVANYQPYPGLVSRANLKIMGDLESMNKSWTPTEWEHRRRLVQFWREQNGNEIRCTFDAISQGERNSNSHGQIVVSCIYWAERNDCFITSVDCIHLLESLMDIRFSVEEKNRVRRNLEGFRPLTVSKCKPDSADFFKLIMSFPNPKPRNIEKDVKVFPWKTLPYALKKIVTKYTASYNNNNNSNALSHTMPVSHSAVHPRSGSFSSASSADLYSARPSSPPLPPSSSTSSSSLSQHKPAINSYYSQAMYRSSFSPYQPPSVLTDRDTSTTKAPTEPIRNHHLPMSTMYPNTTSTTTTTTSSTIPAFASPYSAPQQATTLINRHSQSPSSPRRLSYQYQDIVSAEPMMNQATP